MENKIELRIRTLLENCSRAPLSHIINHKKRNYPRLLLSVYYPSLCAISPKKGHALSGMGSGLADIR